MIKTRSEKESRSRVYVVKCDCTGLKGRWECENTGPAGDDRQDAARHALAAGWARISNRWYCPECQRDHLTPASASKTPL
jgi:rubredoxin